jgi:hypothetical protein
MQTESLERAFAALGLDFRALSPTTEACEAHEWIVKTIPRVGLIISAVVPPEVKMRSLPWEEWYKLEGRLHHHVLYLKKPTRYDEIFEAPDHDDVHPPRTLGKNWYVIDDPDMSAALLRASASP